MSLKAYLRFVVSSTVFHVSDKTYKPSACTFYSDSDFDCRDGLLCAEKHFAEILALGYSDKRKVYCTPPYATGGANGGFQGPSNRLEVCYDPKKLVKNTTKTKL